jgi:hypothetical protein
VNVQLFIKVYNREDQLEVVSGSEETLSPNNYKEMGWTIPNTFSQPIAEIGIEFRGVSGCVYLDYLTWEGEPEIVLTRPFGSREHWEPPLVWRKAWVDAMDKWEVNWPEPYRLVQNEGRGLIMQGTREWVNYQVEADVKPWLMDAGGIAVRVQGLKRFYALQLVEKNRIRLLKALDGDKILGERDFEWEIHESYALKMEVAGSQIRAWVNGRLQFDYIDEQKPLSSGGVAYVVDRGHLSSPAMTVSSINIR